MSRQSIDESLNLKKLPGGFDEQWPLSADVVYNLQRMMGHLSGMDDPIAANTLWWSEQIIRGGQAAKDTKEARRQDQLRAVAVAKLRQKIIQHMPYPPFRDETLAELDNVLRLFGYFK